VVVEGRWPAGWPGGGLPRGGPAKLVQSGAHRDVGAPWTGRRAMAAKIGAVAAAEHIQPFTTAAAGWSSMLPRRRSRPDRGLG